jgi:hypothetical protein
MAISSGIQAAGNKKAKIKGSYHGSASCCIWAAHGPNFWCEASNSAKYYLQETNDNYQSYDSFTNQLKQTREGGKEAILASVIAE